MPAAALTPRPAAARRAHQPPRRRVSGLARAHPQGLPRNRRGDHARSLLPRQRGRLDSRDGPRPGNPLRGQLLGLAGAEVGPPRRRAEDRLGPPPHPGAGTRMGAHGPQGPPVQGQGAPHRLRPSRGRGRRREAPRPRAPDRHPGQPTTRRPGGRGRAPGQGLRRQVAHRGPLVLTAARRNRRRDRRQRSRQDHAVPVARRIRRRHRRSHLDARCRRHPHRPDRRDRLRRPVTRHPRPRTHRLRGDHRRPRVPPGRQARGQRPRLRGVVQLQGHRPAEEGGRPLGRRAQPGAPGQGAQERRQPAAAGRADQRPRR